MVAEILLVKRLTVGWRKVKLETRRFLTIVAWRARRVFFTRQEGLNGEIVPNVSFLNVNLARLYNTAGVDPGAWGGGVVVGAGLPRERAGRRCVGSHDTSLRDAVPRAGGGTDQDAQAPAIEVRGFFGGQGGKLPPPGGSGV